MKKKPADALDEYLLEQITVGTWERIYDEGVLVVDMWIDQGRPFKTAGQNPFTYYLVAT